MKRVCAWCKTELGNLSTGGVTDDTITHGICKKCKEYFFSNKRSEFNDFLDRLAAPVLVVNPEGIVTTANKNARFMLGKDLSQIEGELGGDVMECAYARLPGGCGNTVHCKSCTIRNTVMDTFETGKSRIKVPAYPDIQTPSGVQNIRFLISTEKAENFVLLRIDEIGG